LLLIGLSGTWINLHINLRLSWERAKRQHKRCCACLSEIMDGRGCSVAGIWRDLFDLLFEGVALRVIRLSCWRKRGVLLVENLAIGKLLKRIYFMLADNLCLFVPFFLTGNLIYFANHQIRSSLPVLGY
jgi:hypothetical protein